MAPPWDKAEVKALIDCWTRVEDWDPDIPRLKLYAEMSRNMRPLVRLREKLNLVHWCCSTRIYTPSIIEFKVADLNGPWLDDALEKSKDELQLCKQKECYALVRIMGGDGMINVSLKGSNADVEVWEKIAKYWAVICEHIALDLRDTSDYTAEFCKKTADQLFADPYWYGKLRWFRDHTPRKYLEDPGLYWSEMEEAAREGRSS